MPSAFRQGTTGSEYFGASPVDTTAFPSATLTGSLIAVAVMSSNGTTDIVTSVTDNSSSTYTKILTSGAMSVWYGKNITGRSGHIITVNYSGSYAVAVAAQEFTGVNTTAPLDQSTSATGSSTTPSSGATAATTQANELIIGAVGYSTGTARTITAGSGYSNVTQAAAAALADVGLESRVVSATGTQTATFGLSGSETWRCACATFKDTATGGAVALTGSGAAAASAAGELTVTPSSGGTFNATRFFPFFP